MTTPLFRVPSDYAIGRMGATHRRVAVVPAGDESLRYVMPIPTGWGRATGMNASPGPNRPELLGVYAPTADLGGARLLVSVTRLRWDVDPIAWVCHGWREAGWQTSVARPLPSRWSPRFEVGAVAERSGAYEVRHTVGFVDNGRLLRVDAVAPWPQWEGVRDTMWLCQAYFSLIKPTFCRTVEAIAPYEDERVAFGLPASWRAAQVLPSRAGASRWVARPFDGAASVVVLRIDAVERPRDAAVPMPQRWDRLRKELYSQGIAMSRKVTRVERTELREAPGVAGCFRSEAVNGDQRFEIRVVHCERPGMSIDFTLIIGSPDRHPLERMRAVRGLELAVMRTRCAQEDMSLAG